jgi:hypothetical protein
MSRKVTVIADKDVGPVLGAVAEVNAEEKLTVDQIVSTGGLPMRNSIQVTLEVPPSELATYLAIGDGPLLDPLSYAVVEGVPVAAANSLNPLAAGDITATKITLTLGSAPTTGPKVKAITRRRSDDVVEVFPVATLPPMAGPHSYGVTLRANEPYDLLLLVEGCPAVFQESVTPVP